VLAAAVARAAVHLHRLLLLLLLLTAIGGLKANNTGMPDKQPRSGIVSVSVVQSGG